MPAEDPPAPTRVAYLTSEYPAVSHTFIRREILALEQEVGPVRRFAVRPTTAELPDPADRAEATRTTTLLGLGRGPIARSALRRLAADPRRTARATRQALRMARRSGRGVAVHVAYLLEAAVLVDLLEADGIEHLHVHFGTNPAAVALLARHLGGPPYSVTVHGPDELDAPVALSLADKLLAASFVVAISDFTASQLRRWVPTEAWDRIHVVRCGVDDALFDAAGPVEPGSRLLVSVGRLAPQKDQLLLVEAFADALEGGLDAELVLVGEGPMRPQLEAAIARRGVGDRVRLAGAVDGDGVRDLLRASRAMVLPSSAEGLPVVIMEAFALGRPVLSTYVAGIPELVADGRSGWLVPAGSREALGKAIAEAARTPADELDALGAVGRAAVRARHHGPSEAARLAGLIRAAA